LREYKRKKRIARKVGKAQRPPAANKQKQEARAESQEGEARNKKREVDTISLRLCACLPQEGLYERKKK